MEDYLRVGVITKTHGINGEVKVYPTTDDPKRFKKLKEVVLSNGKQEVSVCIKSVKFFKDQVIVGFKDIDNINDVEKYIKYDILVDRKYAVPLGENENFICDLIGLTVIENGEEIGTLEDVLKTGANDVYIIRMKDGRELLLPAIKQCVHDVNLEDRTITVSVMKGLLD